MPKTNTEPRAPRKPRAAPTDAETSRPLTLPPADTDARALGDRELLEMAIASTQDPKKPGRAIPATRFAAEVAKCNDRTLRRYLAKTDPRPLPALLRERCEEIVAAGARKAARQSQSAAS